MDDKVIEILFHLSNNITGEWLSAILLVFLYCVILLLWRLWRENGLYMFNILAIIAANIQVLKVTPFAFSPEPVALGTLLFATTFTVSDILTEHKGVEAARLGVKLSFTAQIIMTVLMVFTLLYPTQSSDFKGMNSEGVVEDAIQNALFVIFAPSIRILFASLVSYYISQFVDIYVFKYLSKVTHKGLLWLRFNISNMISGLLDNIIFSTLAWVVLSPDPVTMKTLIFTYILGTYGARVIVSFTSTPVMYLSYGIIGKKKK